MQSKTEANNAQNVLQKEITALRETQRGLQMQLRDIEVQNDDFERQARNQNSSLEDLESKYNVAIERSVMLDEEIRIGEQERENLRIENQRLRDDLTDLRIEVDIVQEKLRTAEKTIEKFRQRKTSNLVAGNALRPRSPISDSPTIATAYSSPTAASTPPQHRSNAQRPNITPPSPPLSEASVTVKPLPHTPMPAARRKSIKMDPAATPRPGLYASKYARHTRAPSIPMAVRTPSTSGRATPTIRTTRPEPKSSRPSISGTAAANGLPRSGSLYQIRGLIGRMQKLEERVYHTKSKLPAPTTTPPRASPRTASAMGQIPSTVTVRSNRKRASQASAASTMQSASESGTSRLSFGASRDGSSSRPSSQASRPGSRSSARTPIGHYSSSSISGVEGRLPRPRSSMSGQSNLHSQSMSLSGSVREDADADYSNNSDGSTAATPVARRMTLEKKGIPTPSGLPRRQSHGRRTSSSIGGDSVPMPPPARPRKMSEVEEF